MQLQKVIGELRALETTFYDPEQGNTKDWRNARELIEDMIQDLVNNFG